MGRRGERQDRPFSFHARRVPRRRAGAQRRVGKQPRTETSQQRINTTLVINTKILINCNEQCSKSIIS